MPRPARPSTVTRRSAVLTLKPSAAKRATLRVSRPFSRMSASATLARPVTVISGVSPATVSASSPPARPCSMVNGTALASQGDSVVSGNSSRSRSADTFSGASCPVPECDRRPLSASTARPSHCQRTLSSTRKSVRLRAPSLSVTSTGSGRVWSRNTTLPFSTLNRSRVTAQASPSRIRSADWSASSRTFSRVSRARSGSDGKNNVARSSPSPVSTARIAGSVKVTSGTLTRRSVRSRLTPSTLRVGTSKLGASLPSRRMRSRSSWKRPLSTVRPSPSPVP